MDLDLNEDVKHWGIPDVNNWLSRNGMTKYIGCFADNYMDGAKLLNVDLKLLTKTLRVNRQDADAIIYVIQEFKYNNPDDIYEVGSGDEMDEGEWDDDDEYSDDGQVDGQEDGLDYVPPEQFPVAVPGRRPPPSLPNGNGYPQQSHNQPRGAPTRDLPPTPQEEEDDEPNSDYEVPDGPDGPESTPPPVLPSRPSKPGKLIGTGLGPGGKAPRKPPTAAESPPPDGRLTSMPEVQAPGYPKSNTGGGRQFRPPAPSPMEHQRSQPSPHRPPPKPAHIDVTPSVPLGQGLDDLEDNYEETDLPPPLPSGGARRPSLPYTPQFEEPTPSFVEDDQENYEEVSSSPPASVTHTPHSTLPRSLQGKKLPPTPQGDDDSGGSFTSNHSGGGGSLPRRPKHGETAAVNYPLTIPNKTNRTKYPLVTLPASQQQSAPPAPTSAKPKKYIPSYNETTIQQERIRSQEQNQSARPLPTKPLPAKPLPVKPLPSKPLPEPVQEPAQPKFKPAQYKPSPRPAPAPVEVTEANNSTNVDTSNMSVKERMALLSGKAMNQSAGQPPMPGNKPSISPRPGAASKPKPNDIMGEMMRKQKERVNQEEPQATWKNQSTPPKPVAKPWEKPTPSPPVNHRPAEPKPAPMVPHTPKPQSFSKLPPTKQPQAPPQLPPGRQAGAAPPPIPTTERPSGRARTGSTASTSSSSTTGGMDERGLYGYAWYHSDISRSESLKNYLGHHDGAFVVRKSTKDPTKPYTLDVRYQNNEFHIPIRQRDDGKFAMGGFKEGENTWEKLPDMVAYFKASNVSLTKKQGGRDVRGLTMLIE